MSAKKKLTDIFEHSKKALIAAVEYGEAPETESSLEELSMLLGNLGIPVAARVVQRRRESDSYSFIGSGKAEEIKDFAKKIGASLLIVDDFLSPTQKSNLQKLSSVEVWDRAFVIMKIFESRAHTSEAKLQVELAQYRYERPSLKGLGHQMSRTGGGIGTRGPGETEFERHRRKLERRIKVIAAKLDEVRKRRKERRDNRKRRGFPTAALVGYTNSGKSTLLRALSKDDKIRAANQLFSTLDTVVRCISFMDGGSFLLSDTVGFIRKLPPELIAAFRATLEEVANADMLLLVLDASAPDPMNNFDVVIETLREIEADELPRVVVLNKTDRARDSAEFTAAELRAKSEKVVMTCALSGEGFEELLSSIKECLSEGGAIFKDYMAKEWEWADCT